jgi:hypothetical protein
MYRSVEKRYDFRIVNNTERVVEVVAMRGETEIRRIVVRAESTQRFIAPTVSEEELKDISFRVNLDFVPPAPPEPEVEEEETAPAEGESTETETPEGGATGEGESETPEGGAEEEPSEPGGDAGAGGETEAEGEGD